MRHHARQFRFLVRMQDQAAIHVEESARQRERVHHVRIDHLDRERHARVRIAHQILPHAVHVFVHHGVVDELRALIDFLRELLAERDLVLERVEVQSLAHVAVADGVDVRFAARLDVRIVLLRDGLGLVRLRCGAWRLRLLRGRRTLIARSAALRRRLVLVLRAVRALGGLRILCGGLRGGLLRRLLSLLRLSGGHARNGQKGSGRENGHPTDRKRSLHLGYLHATGLPQGDARTQTTPRLYTPFAAWSL